MADDTPDSFTPPQTELAPASGSADATLVELDEAGRKDLAAAVRQLEEPSFAGKLTDMLGQPIEMLLNKMPESLQGKVDDVTETALQKALEVALKTLDEEQAAGSSPWNLTHKLSTAVTGAAGGFFGLPALAVELPITTVVMMRSIADIARSKGEDLSDPEARLACLEVFALGSGGAESSGKAIEYAGQLSTENEEFVQASYYIARAALAQSVKNVVEQFAKGGVKVTAQPMMALVSRVASRFGVAVSEKAAAQAVPVLGAVGGGMINVMFTDHFQDTAEAHFTVRALERKHGEQTVKDAYNALAAKR